MTYKRSGKALALRSFTASYILGVLTFVAIQAGVNRYIDAFMAVLIVACQVFGYLCILLIQEDRTVYDYEEEER